jgi:hypothetical protein
MQLTHFYSVGSPDGQINFSAQKVIGSMKLIALFHSRIFPLVFLMSSILEMVNKHFFEVQSNLYTTTTLGTPNLWLLLTGGRCSKVGFCYEDSNWDSKMVVAVGGWSLFGGGR